MSEKIMNILWVNKLFSWQLSFKWFCLNHLFYLIRDDTLICNHCFFTSWVSYKWYCLLCIALHEILCLSVLHNRTKTSVHKSVLRHLEVKECCWISDSTKIKMKNQVFQCKLFTEKLKQWILFIIFSRHSDVMILIVRLVLFCSILCQKWNFLFLFIIFCRYI